MSETIELELTFLAKSLPLGLENCRSKEIIDLYFPAGRPHPVLRLRQNGENFEMTKKSPVQEGDSSVQRESTILLDAEEFASLAAVPSKLVRKVRYYYPWQGRTCEIDVFRDALEGLVLVDVEFDRPEDKLDFRMPDFCLADVTQEEFVAGGMLCGKNYADIEKDLEGFGYRKLTS